LGFGLLAILIHSFSDFGQHMPANACLSALSCGLLVGLARREAPEHTLRGSTAVFRASVAARAVVTLLIAAIFVWAIDEARNAYGAESHWRQALRAENTLRENDWLGTNEEYDELLSHAEQAVARQPANVNYRHWLNVYRWHAISRVTDPETGNLVVTAQTLEFTKRIVDELNQARVLCPTFGATYCVAGQLEKFVLNEPAGSRNIRKGFELAPCDATACYTAGLLDVLEGQIDASFEKFSRALELDGSLIKDIVDVYVRQVNRPDLAVAIAGDNIGRLSQVANVLSETAGQEDLAVKARSEATKLLKAKCEQPDAPAWVLASMANVCRQENDYNDAADYYKRALSLDYGQVDWRLNLAQILAKSGQVSEAIREARVCLRLRPQMTAATKLIEDLSVLPNAIQERN
jgi:tetratricopeptide (TPR) repeat protein